MIVSKRSIFYKTLKLSLPNHDNVALLKRSVVLICKLLKILCKIIYNILHIKSSQKPSVDCWSDQISSAHRIYYGRLSTSPTNWYLLFEKSTTINIGIYENLLYFSCPYVANYYLTTRTSCYKLTDFKLKIHIYIDFFLWLKQGSPTPGLWPTTRPWAF